MATVRFDFIAPDDEHIVALRIFEAPDKTGPYVEIERVTEIGTYPDFISSWKTDDASNPGDWFKIAWEDDAGLLGERSGAVQGGTQTLVGNIVSRVHERDSSLDLSIIQQEVESSVEMYFNDDPYDVELSDLPHGMRYRILNGLTYLSLARAMIAVMATSGSSTVADSTIGLVRMTSGTSSSQAQAPTANVEELINAANRELGWLTSIVLEMQRVRERDNDMYGLSTLYLQVLEP